MTPDQERTAVKGCRAMAAVFTIAFWSVVAGIISHVAGWW